MGSALKLVLKWNSKEYVLEFNENDTVLDLKNEIEKQTGVKIERQKLLNLKIKGKVYFHYISVFIRFENTFL